MVNTKLTIMDTTITFTSSPSTDTLTVENILRKIRDISPPNVVGPDIYYDDLGDNRKEGFVVKIQFIEGDLGKKNPSFWFRSETVLNSLLDCFSWLQKNPR